MSQKMDDIIYSKSFYRDKFRSAVKILFFNMMLMAVLTIAIFFLKVTQRAPDYYATNSSGFITSLTALDEPNMTSTALLQPDPPEEVNLKELTIDQ